MKHVLAAWAMLGCVLAEANQPQYVFVNIAEGAGIRRNTTEDRYRAWLTEVRDRVGASDSGPVRLGVSFIFSTLAASVDEQVDSLRGLLRASETTGVPVLVTVDGQNWWEDRPELWNWWNPRKRGYDPQNVYNVEWTGWSPAQAVKIGWRNWGAQLRVAPAQNIASPPVLKATVEPLRVLAEILAEWQRSLPPEKRHLFGGIKVGWEAGIGYNSFFYPGGNLYATQWPDNESHDPRRGLDSGKGLDGGLAQLGYAAVRTAGIRDSGALTRDDLARVIQTYLERLATTALEAGIPQDRIFVHQGGTYAPYDQHIPYRAAFNDVSIPGWSFYWANPETAGPVKEELEGAGRRQWTAAEWWWPGKDAAEWEDHFRKTLGFMDCRLICVYNWENGLRDDPAGIEALRAVLK